MYVIVTMKLAPTCQNPILVVTERCKTKNFTLTLMKYQKTNPHDFSTKFKDYFKKKL